MYFTSDSMLPENQQPLIITVAPYGPQWLPSDYPEDSAKLVNGRILIQVE